MEIFFNELSRVPLAKDREAAKDKILNLLGTLKALRSDGYNVMRVSENFYELELADNYRFASFFEDQDLSRDLKTLLVGVTRRPYIQDDNSYEAEMFILSDFATTDEVNSDLSPEGLAIAYVYNSPVISLSGNAHWQSEWIPLTITTTIDDTKEIVNEKVINVHSVESVAASYFREWLKTLIGENELNSEANILKVFSPDRFLLEPRALTDILFWYYNDKRFIVRIKGLINDIADNPFVGGKGHTETLAGTGGRASKRIVKKDRIVYTFTKERITIHQCRGHYDD